MSIRIGSGAGFARDRIDPAARLAEDGALDYLVFEVLGERTIAAANARKRSAGAEPAYDVLLERRLEAVLPACVRHGTKIITNGGAADPVAAAETALDVARRLGYPQLSVAVIEGDEVSDALRSLDPIVWETGQQLSASAGEPISANAYIGAEAVHDALAMGADIVIGGRIADPSLFVGAIAHGCGFDPTADADHIARATVTGHLLECAGQVTGGYFADSGTKAVPDLAWIGFPFADVEEDGSFTISKVEGTGGSISVDTVREQLLYEIDDPGRYITPDVIADFTDASVKQIGTNRVAVFGGRAVGRPDELKVTLGFDRGWLGEGQISYAGPRAVERARLAADIVATRLEGIHGLDRDTLSVEHIGTGAAFRGLDDRESSEVRLRVAASTPTSFLAEAVGWEVEALYTNGPAGGGGARSSVSPVLAIQSCTVPRDVVDVTIREVV